MVFTLGAELTARLRSLARAEGVTLYMLMLAAFQLMLAHHAGQEDILVGSPMAGRSQAAYTAVVGHFVNMVVVRVQCRRQEPFRQFLAQVRDKVLAALDHQEFPFALLVERLHAGRDPSRSPIFQVSFDLQQLRRFGDLAPLFVPNHPGAAVNVAGLTLEPYVIPQQEGQFDLALQLAEGDDAITGAFKFSTALFDADTVSRMQRTYETILEKILTDPNSAPSTWLAGPERHGQAAELSGLLAQLRELDIKLWVDGEKLPRECAGGQPHAGVAEGDRCAQGGDRSPAAAARGKQSAGVRAQVARRPRSSARSAAALFFTAAAVVPGPDESGFGRVQHTDGGNHRGAARCGGAAPQPGRGCGTPRGAAHAVCSLRW